MPAFLAGPLCEERYFHKMKMVRRPILPATRSAQSLAQKTPDKDHQKQLKQHRAARNHSNSEQVQSLDISFSMIYHPSKWEMEIISAEKRALPEKKKGESRHSGAGK